LHALDLAVVVHAPSLLEICVPPVLFALLLTLAFLDEILHHVVLGVLAVLLFPIYVSSYYSPS
jgi:hypothetical protein